MTERRTWAAEDEVERLDLLRVRLASVERFERLQHFGTADGGLPYRHAIGERKRRVRPSDRRTIASHACAIQLRSSPSGSLGFSRWPEAMLRPAILAVLAVIDTLAQQLRLAVAIAQEERVTLSGNRQAPQLPLLVGLGIEVVAFDLEDRLLDAARSYGLSRRAAPRSRALAPMSARGSPRARLASIRSARAGDEAAVLGRDDRHGVGILHRVRAAAIGDKPLQQREQQMAAAGNERGQRRETELAGRFGMLHGALVRLGSMP